MYSQVADFYSFVECFIVYLSNLFEITDKGGVLSKIRKLFTGRSKQFEEGASSDRRESQGEFSHNLMTKVTNKRQIVNAE